MYTTPIHLQSAIRTALQKGQLCRIYHDSLVACWPHLPDELRAQKVAAFAAQNRWSVQLRTLGNMGIVAEFEALQPAPSE
jgi:hypothetical protein